MPIIDLHGGFCVHVQVLELLTEGENESFDAMCLLRTLGQVKSDLVDKKLTPVIDVNRQSAPVVEEADSFNLQGESIKQLCLKNSMSFLICN